jgi:hypothetical protein
MKECIIIIIIIIIIKILYFCIIIVPYVIKECQWIKFSMYTYNNCIQFNVPCKRMWDLQLPNVLFSFLLHNNQNRPEAASMLRLPDHTTLDTHPTELLWTDDQLVEKAATYTAHNKHMRRISKPPATFVTAFPAIKGSQTWPLVSTPTRTGVKTRLILSIKSRSCTWTGSFTSSIKTKFLFVCRTALL